MHAFAAVTLTQVSPTNSTVCPGQDLVYQCISNISFDILWREITANGEFVGSAVTTNVGQNVNLNFTIQVIERTFTPPASIVSTATLENALLSHTNITIECFNSHSKVLL